MQRAKERLRKRVEKGAAKRKAVAALLESPSPKRKKSAENSVSFESLRSKLLQRLAQDLASPKYQVYYRAIGNCRTESVTPAEARENGLDKKLRQLLTRDKTLPVKCAAEKVIKSWAESQLLSSFLVLRVFNETGLCIRVHSYSLIHLPFGSSKSLRRSCTANEHCQWQLPLDEYGSMLFTYCNMIPWLQATCLVLQ